MKRIGVFGIVGRNLNLSLRNFSSSRIVAAVVKNEHGYHHEVADSKLHPEKFAQIGKEWPKEYHDPSNYVPLGYPEDPTFHGNLGHTTENPLGTETVTNRHEDFSAPAYYKLIGGLLVGSIILYGVNHESMFILSPSGERSHIITEWFRCRMTTFADIVKDNRVYVAIQEDDADNRLIAQHVYKRPHRFKFPETFDRCSDHLIEPGSQADLSDMKFKFSWEVDDEIMGKPYPKNQ
ncbi:hypothetical protein HK098_001714 [Nowakowskiella sp. JEL0407]|nr:hypothetical protein HK098_001714 [Nowakowskiella sp. JEL0407]